ncbi:MAG TPA: response regulator transcription factor [Candidatus Binatia bacterium]|jgi:DNA-binding NarL/FixJ family response regulator|nr:response regulator transcription factor [Candidatus Binatia bacterium]
MKPTRVLLAEDHALVRAGIRALLQNLTGVQVVGEASDGREALRLINTYQPDVVLMDIAMAGLNGLEATARVTKEFPTVRVIILSMHSTEEYVAQALRAGAAGYLLKDAAAAELELAVTSVARGETYLSPAVSKHVIADYLRRAGGVETSAAEGTSSPSALLTPRQREILQLIAEGHSTKEIAAILHLSVKTIETHRMQLMARLDVHDVAGLVRYAIRIGLVMPDK